MQLAFFPEYQDDREVVLVAISKNAEAYQYASNRLKNDRSIIMTALQGSKHAEIWFDLPWHLREDPELASIAIDKDPLKFERMRPVIQDNRDMVLRAIRHNGVLLAFASDRLQRDPELQRIAVSVTPSALSSTPDLQDDREVVLAAVSRHGLVLEYASNRLKNDLEVLTKAIQNNGEAIQYAPDWIKNDYAYAMMAVRSNGYAIELLSPELASNIDIQLAAYNSASGIILDLPALQNDIRFMTSHPIFSQRLEAQWQRL